MSAEEIRSGRLVLRPLDARALTALVEGRVDEARALVGAPIPEGWPDAHDARFLSLRRDELRAEPERVEWLVRAVLTDGADPELVGHAGFHGPPGRNGPEKPGALEIGYTVFEPYRGRGYATEAADALIGWASARHAIRDFIASVAPDNAPSLAVVRKLGFEQTGEQWDDEDGLELVFELRR